MERRVEEQAPRRVVGSYSSYAEAQRAVDHLSDEGFAVERVSIVAEGLRFVEQVTGRVGTGGPLCKEPDPGPLSASSLASSSAF
ncbi:MAG TPA: general stress protein [Rubrobacteraceae bacterium]|nr:general stress protein [Rubrobacteraceae bacterium]